ncbi:peptidoglycan bridge formation glycyltransferase FemA/FemB family protein [Marispirochaeta sp.]|jgi:lipid II:glycine glycyltransferase (peptidoglycan interpeptide bridge formation enzyme)|uniref:lipid II:glycine glycyltransferase FemX n=1 Tax=Marispirochaeta sp. TaxID=2038653 RepID=UPI0029C99D7F|nr:peptidoglycan bridge formation glycyltransferase FemA/FemB family protein [Marispirochaeta sp.]
MDVSISRRNKENIRVTPVLQQTAFWSEVKRLQGVSSRAFRISVNPNEADGTAGNDDLTDDILVLFQDIGDGYSIAYVPYGPRLNPGEENFGPFLEELSEILRSYLPEGCILLRYDLLWRSPWSYDKNRFNDNGDWLGPPEQKSQEIRVNFPTRYWNLKKAESNILPADTVFIDVRRTEDELLGSMRAKTRYNIRLSRRRGVEVVSADKTSLDTWYMLYRETCRRNKINLHGRHFFRAVAEAAKVFHGDSTDVELLIARADGKALAAMFLVTAGKRATYLYGASATGNRNLMPTYALQWDAIKRARRKGCREYDMFGVSPSADKDHPMYGLYRFKTGFGGYIFHRMGCWDYPLNTGLYEQMRTLEMGRSGYHV